MRVQITKLPLDKAAYGKQVDGSLSLKPGAFGGADYKPMNDKNYKGVKQTIGAVPRDEANLEAEGGETAFGPISGQSIPDHLKIVGKRHTEGGVPLNLPDDTFIFSDTASLRINDPNVLAMFNKVPKKGGYTPAELAKPYVINKYKAILLDPESSKLERDTATIMIKNFIMKLGALAVVQESMKGFPQGIPAMAKPYMEANGISEEDLIPELKQQAEALEQSMSSGQETDMSQQQNPMMEQEMQQMAPEQAMQQQQQMMQQPQGAPSYPEQMPSGAPVASPESMAQMQGGMPSEQMMQQPPMAYGGIPYGAYGIEMGSFYNDPNEMAYGGVPKFQGPGNSQVVGDPGRQPGHRVIKPDEYKGYQGNVYKDTQGEYKHRSYRDKVEGRADYKSASAPGGGGPNPNLDAQLCKNMTQKGTAHYGKSALEVMQFAYSHHYNSDGTVKPEYATVNAQIKGKLDGCELEAAKEKQETVSTGEPVETPCPCEDEQGNVIEGMFAKQDENGNCLPETCGTTTETETLKCKCTDPVTGEVKEFPIEKEEDCVCQDGSQGQTVMGDSPHLSYAAKRNIMANLAMQTAPAPSNVILPGRASIKNTLEEYQTKVDTAQSAGNAIQNAIMSGMAGSTASKQAQMKDVLGKVLRSSMDAVAGVQSRNVDRENQAFTQQAGIDNQNIRERTGIMNQGLQMQNANQNLRTTGRNKKIMNLAKAWNEGENQMVMIQNRNTLTPQFAADYDQGFIHPTGVEKPLTGAIGPDRDARINAHMKGGMTYKEAVDTILKEDRLYKNTAKRGGYVYTDSWNPFIM